MEFKPFRTEVVVLDDRVVTRNITLEAGLIELESAVISTERGEQLNTVRMSVESIQPSDIKRIPSLGGTPDLVQVLQTLPGFVSQATRADSSTSAVARPSRTRSCSTA